MVTAQHGPEWLDGRPAATTARPRWRAARVAAIAAAVLVLGGVASLPLWPDDEGAEARGPRPGSPVIAARSPVPGALSVSTRSIHVSSTARSTSFGIANTGDLPVIYQVSTRTPWITTPAIGGSLGGETGSRVDVFVDRSAATKGRMTGTVVVSWDGGADVVVRVHVR